MLSGERRWSLAYGANASPDRLIDKGLDLAGAVLLPASVLGWQRAWEARRTTSTSAIPLTLHRSASARLDVMVLGIVPEHAELLDLSEGRGSNYVLARVGPVAVASRFLLEDALAYGPTSGTRLLLHEGRVVVYPDADQVAAAALFDVEHPVSLPTAAVADVGQGWPDTPLSDLPLFVYGTLQPGRSRWSAIEAHVEVLGVAHTTGHLTATVFGWPAADFTREGRIQGTLLRPRSPRAATELYAECDRIEDVPALFCRVSVPVLHDHEPVWAASYQWNLDQGAPPGTEVADGRWIP